jgi:hypothetical protein
MIATDVWATGLRGASADAKIDTGIPRTVYSSTRPPWIFAVRLGATGFGVTDRLARGDIGGGREIETQKIVTPWKKVVLDNSN